MTKNIILTAIFSALCLFTTIGKAEIACRELEHADGKNRIEIENSFFRIAIEPGTGGKIASWFDKVAGVEIVHWKAEQLSGMLDDRGARPMAKYAAEIVAQDDEHVIISLSVREKDDLEVVKTLTFHDSPVVNVRYTYRNHSQHNLFGFAIGVRNFFIPGGGESVTEDDLYSVPTTHAIRRLKGFSMRRINGPFPEFGTKLKTSIARPWASFIDTVSKQGLALSVEDDFYTGWYAWKGGAATPTFEWMYGDLPAGYERGTELNLIQVNGLAGTSYASPEILSDMNVEIASEGKGSIRTEIMALTDDWSDCRLETSLRQVGTVWKRQLPPREFEELSQYDVHNFDLDLALPGNGLYEIRQTLRQDGKIRAEWVDSISIGGVSTEPLFGMEYRSALECNAIPGWKAEEEVVVVGDPASVARGYGILALTGDDEGKDIAEWNCQITRNEYESFPLMFHPFRRLGRVAVSLSGGDEVGARVRVEEVTPFDSRNSGEGISYAYLLRDWSEFDGGESARIWVTLGTGDLAPGDYRFDVVFSPQGGAEAKSVAIKVKVHDISLPNRPIISLEAEGYPMSFPQVGLALRENRDGGVMDGWFENMASHGIDFFQEIIGYENGRIDSYLRVLGEDTTLARDKKNRPEKYSEGKNLPEIDFSAFDFYFDRALAAGLVRFKTSRYDISPSTPEAIWRYRQLNNYLRAKGYSLRDMFIKILDEQPANRFPDMARTAKWLKEECGFRPFSTFDTLFRYPEHLKILNPYFDMYQGGFTTREDWQARLREGVLDADDEVGIYTGWGTMSRTYEEQAAFGWNAAFHGHSFFHNHEYMRGGNGRKLANIILIDDDNLPVDSPSFEGLRDGMECANLIALYREWRELLKSAPGARELFAKLDQELDAIMAESEDAIIAFQKIDTHSGFTRKIKPLTMTATTTAHAGLIKLLNQVAPLAKSETKALASASWGEMDIYGPRVGVVCEAASGKAPEEKAAALFSETLRSALGGVTLTKDEGDNITVSFRLMDDTRQFPYTYLIERLSPSHIEIRGSSQDNLVLGGRNFIRTLRIKGAWL